MSTNLIDEFTEIWLPPDNSHPKFWFRARLQKHNLTIRNLCEKFLPIVQSVSSIDQIFNIFPEASDLQLIVFAIMMDQMPRNALALGLVDSVDDTLSLAFAHKILPRIKQVNDERVVCFFSLIFRHANNFEQTRAILEMNSPESTLTSVFQKETDKREKSSR